MKNMRYLALAAIFTLAMCTESTDIEVCSSEQGRFIEDTHYIESKFLTEDKTWNYKAWNAHRKKEAANKPNPNCIPEKTDTQELRGVEGDREMKNTTEQIEDLEEEIDLTR